MTNNINILFCIFNRPTQTTKVFEVIKKARPVKLFISADGPRLNYNEDELCKKTRFIATQVDWPCEVHTLFRETNSGLGKTMSEAISWFFDHVEQGIILEDDCVPDLSFFKFCDILLDKYAETPKVMAISGINWLPNGWKPEKQSYVFGHCNIWGWATWKRAWDLYDYNMPDWKNKGNKDKIRRAIKSNNWFDYYVGMFEDASQQLSNTWDIQWVHCILNNEGVAISPSVNLVRNIGFGPGATHTTQITGIYANLIAHEIKFPLKHPSEIKVDKKYLRASFKYVFEYDKTFTRIIKSWIRLYLKRLKENR